MPVTGINVMLSGITTQVVRNVNEKSVIDFYVKEHLGERESRNFHLEVRHNPTNNYLANKTSSINSANNIRSTTAILVGNIHYEEPTKDPSTGEELTPGKHVLELEDISLIPVTQSRINTRPLNLPWSNNSSPETNGRTSRTPRSTNTRKPKKGRQTLSQMEAISTDLTTDLTAALNANPLPPNFPTSSSESNNNTLPEV